MPYVDSLRVLRGAVRRLIRCERTFIGGVVVAEWIARSLVFDRHGFESRC